MFDKITVQPLRSGDAANPLDLAFVGEAMLFYETVEVAANRAILQQLVRELGSKLLLKFLKQKFLRIRFEPNFEGIITENTGTTAERHMPSVAEIQGQDLLGVLEPIVVDSIGWFTSAKKMASRLAENINSCPIDPELATRTAADFGSPSYIADAIRRILKVYTPDVAPNSQFRFLIIRTRDNKFFVNTDLDFRMLNESYHRRILVTHSTLSPAYLLSHLLTARKMVEDGARSNAEIAAAPVYRELISAKVQTAFQQRDLSAANMEAFQTLAFENGRSISGVLRSKERSFGDLLKILKRAKRFRHWLRNQPPSEKLIKAYFDEVTKGSWIDKLPVKTARWSIFMGAGRALDHLAGTGDLGTAAGVGLSAADFFLFDRLAKGWKPNQFVDKALQNFVAGRDS
jgi:hypothetical protein